MLGFFINNKFCNNIKYLYLCITQPKTVMEHIKTEGEIHTYELTTTEIELIRKNISKPPRFSYEEKSLLTMICNGFLEDHPNSDECTVIEKILKKLN